MLTVVLHILGDAGTGLRWGVEGKTDAFELVTSCVEYAVVIFRSRRIVELKSRILHFHVKLFFLTFLLHFYIYRQGHVTAN